MNEAIQLDADPKLACPVQGVGAGFNPHYRDELYAALAAARTKEPVFYCEEIGYWIVTRHADAMEILSDPDRFSARNTTERVTPMHEDALQILKEGNFAPEQTQSTIDPPKHTRIRAATTPLLNVRSVSLMEPQVRNLVLKALDKLNGKKQVDLHKEFNYELPAQVIFKVLGIPEDEIPLVKKLSQGRTRIDFSPATYDQQIEGAHLLVGLWNYTVELVRKRLENPGNDFISGLIKTRNGDDSILTINEINTITYGLVFAGHETTTNQLTNTFREILTKREIWEEMCRDPSVIPTAVEEGLRLYGAVIGWRRIAKQDVVLSGVTIPAGARVMMSFASANRDPEVFQDPDKFDLRRANSRKQLTLGNGIHHCLGAPLARLEMKIVFEEFTKRYPNMRILENDKPEHLHTFVFRASDTLMVELEP
jgi:cytochrome P450